MSKTFIKNINKDKKYEYNIENWCQLKLIYLL